MIKLDKLLYIFDFPIQFSVEPGDVPATLSLARYLRDYLELTGTKVSCNQSGCGACVVTAEVQDPNGTNGSRTKSVNSVS